MTTSIDFAYGAGAEPLREQIKRQHRHVGNDAALEHLQRDADAVTRLVVRSLLSDSAARAIRQRLQKRLLALIIDEGKSC